MGFLTAALHVKTANIRKGNIMQHDFAKLFCILIFAGLLAIFSHWLSFMLLHIL